MDRVVLEGSEAEVSRLSFGTASLHHLPRSPDRQRVLAAARDYGLTHFDTAPYYGFGIAEHEIGKFLGGRKGEVTVATKVGLYPPGKRSRGTGSVWLRKGLGKMVPRLAAPLEDWSVKSAQVSLDESLKALGIDEIDLLLLHEPVDGAVDMDDFWDWVQTEKRKGRIRGWGLAGQAEQMRPWVSAIHPIAQVLQVRDSIDRNEADQLQIIGRKAQITFGYLSARHRLPEASSIAEVLRTAMMRNRCGSVLISTTKVHRLRELADIAERANGKHH